MNLNERLNVDSYFNHIRQTNRLFFNYMNILEIQENNLTNLLNNRNSINQNNNLRWRSYYPYTQRINRGNVIRPRNNLPNNSLTNNEIDRLTNVCNFSSVTNPINTSCPITFEDFLPNDRVMVINHCRHIFNESSLRNWFTYNTHCPLCRHNLRENTNRENTNRENTNGENTNRENMLYYYTNYFNNSIQSQENNISENQTIDISENITNDVSNNLNNVIENIFNAYSYHNDNNINSGQTATTLSTGTIYNNTTDQTIDDLSNNTQYILNQWNQNIMNQLSNLIQDDVSGNIQLEYRMFSS